MASKNGTGDTSILYTILPEMAQYLDVDLILMYMFSAKGLTGEDYDNLMRIRDTGQPKSRLCNEIAVLITRKKSLDKFKKALEGSKAQHAGHDELLKLIMDKEIESSPEEPMPKPPSLIVNTEQEEPLEDLQDRPHSASEPKNDPKFSITSAQSVKSPHKASQEAAEGQAESQEATSPESDSASISSFCLGSLCAGLTVIVLALAGSGIALMYYAAEGWMGKVTCKIKIDPPVDPDDPDPEQSSIFAFNFISGFLCLVIPTIFLLLLSYSICKDFKKEVFDKSIVRKVLIMVIVAYIAVCILIGITQLALSFYVASLIYPSYRQYLNAEAPVNMTMPATEPSTASPGINQLECDQVVYLSAFVTLTMTYILIFVFLAVLVGIFIAAKVADYFHMFVDNYFTDCLRALKCAEAANNTTAGGEGGGGGRRNTSTSASVALVEANDDTAV